MANNISIGNCGEYFVAAELERRGFSVAVPMSNTPNFDVLAICRKNNKQVAIQVKTTKSGELKWMLDRKNESLEGENIYYIFVHLHELGTPEYFIIPSNKVAKIVRDGHAYWLTQLDRKGNPHKDSNVRTFFITKDLENYKDAWEILE